MANSVGARIENLRKEKNLSQGDLGKLVGLTQQGVASVEKKDSVPKKIVEFAEALGVSIDYLRTGISECKKSTEKNDSLQLESYSLEELQAIIPKALDRTIISLNKQVKARKGRELDLIQDRTAISKLLTSIVLSELSGDYELISAVYNELNLAQGE
ncbi:helix-turn-helix domain-containing protein [Pseudoalteromonas obscura]|uniref:Helix-turn-helix transcriptional regulator n=1 Tax=Pseudoalteromonas obscura TaxID=3048491 RepID=A0ABT7EH86_9GAMM|nr:helix-turn-helix transcriptional regulator [Pseudoalteromonas sp. P94(2023)]MDK2594417.1 helix-turn-helix transcriptional regulator [Pseudoalteromonas sp. P94(2023)]